MTSCIEELEAALEGKLHLKRINTALEQRIAELEGALREIPQLELDDERRLLGKSIMAYNDWLVRVANLLHPGAELKARAALAPEKPG